MNISLNNEIIKFKIEDEKNIGEVLGKIEEQCQAKKMTVTEVRSNGKALLPQELDDFFMQEPSDDFNIELFTISGEDIKNIARGIGKKFIALAEDLETVPVKMQSSEDEQVIKIIENFSLNLKQLYSTAKCFDLADISPYYKFGDKTLAEYQKEISEKLEMLIEGFENGDSIEVSDISEYELSPLAKELGNELLSI